MLGHQYVRFHEVPREKDAKGQAAYEAIVFIGWDESASQYACLWLDSTGGGGLSAQAIGHAKRSGDEIAFLFKGKDGSIFRTTFAYSKVTDTWQWLMDGEEGGKLQPFARVRLTKESLEAKKLGQAHSPHASLLQSGPERLVELPCVINFAQGFHSSEELFRGLALPPSIFARMDLLARTGSA